MLDNTKIRFVEPKGFERGMREAIYIRALKPSLNKDGGRYNLPPSDIIKERGRQPSAGEAVNMKGMWKGELGGRGAVYILYSPVDALPRSSLLIQIRQHTITKENFSLRK